jgi:hypothetical protein
MTNICLFASLLLFFLGRSIGMATDIGFLAAGLDGHVVGIGIERKLPFHFPTGFLTPFTHHN